MVAKEDLVEWFDMEQRSDEWFEVRRGIPTSSQYKCVMASGRGGEESKTREDYQDKLVGEALSGIVNETFRNEAMQRGIRVEPAALEWYERHYLCDLQRVGFVRRTVHSRLGSEYDFVTGGSPDAWLPKERRIVEVKTMRHDMLVKVEKKGAAAFPSEHRAQCQGNMWLAGADTCDLVLFNEGWRRPPIFRIARDNAYIATMVNQIEVFCHEVRTVIADIKRKGGWE